MSLRNRGARSIVYIDIVSGNSCFGSTQTNGIASKLLPLVKIVLYCVAFRVVMVVVSGIGKTDNLSVL